MAFAYNGKRTRNIYKPGQTTAFRLSRSRIENYMRCARCFYIDRRLGVDQPPGFPFNLNNAVDTLLKKEFDVHRVAKSAHPLFEHYGIKAVPFVHPQMNEWRENFKGVRTVHVPTNFEITGAVDDLWQLEDGSLAVVDYKSTSKEGEVSLDAPWQDGYKRQMEIYQWLLRQNGFDVSDTGYFVYVNGRTDLEAFDAKLEFDVKILSYSGSDAWIEGVLEEIKETLESDEMPPESSDCDYCLYRRHALNVIVGHVKSTKR
ncbi:MAG: PD-(D/E)XK nuclease family protein [bacterium]|nr:PD-(D/E)XK nuclease family protein [bacterium]